MHKLRKLNLILHQDQNKFNAVNSVAGIECSKNTYFANKLRRAQKTLKKRIDGK